MIAAMRLPTLRLGLPIFSLFLTVFTGCDSKKPVGTPLAKVGDATLTLEDVRHIFPVEFEQALPREQYLDFVKRWIDDEVIYQQAAKAGLDKDSNVARRIEDMRRKLLIEEFMAREGAAEAVEPEEAALSQYYEMHREEFRRKAPEWRILSIRVKSLKDAMDLRPKLKGNDFLAQAQPYMLDPMPENLETLPYRKAQELRSCMQAIIPATPVGQVAGPLTCHEGVLLVKVLDRVEAGSLIPFAEMRDHIAGILMMERKSKQREGTVARYKEGAVITFNLDKIPGREIPLDEGDPSPGMESSPVSEDPPQSARPGPEAHEEMAHVENAGRMEIEKPKPKFKTPDPPPEAVPSADEMNPANEPAGARRSDPPMAPATDTASHAMP